VGAANQSASHYALLGLSPQATGPELRQAFRSLSKRYHPDTTTLPEAEAQEAFRLLQQAYLTLSDPERRRAYDASLVAVQPVRTPPTPVRLTTQPAPVRRALLLLALAVVFSLVLGVGLAWARGAEFVRVPSWWPPAGQTAEPGVALADVSSATPPGTALQPPAAGLGAVAQ
jgi:preprotein translocase subunit Sec63